MTLPAWFRDRDWRTGGYHALGALAIQCVVALLWPGAWWWGALAGGGFWTLREVITCIRAGRLQERFRWDVLTAVLPVLAVAVAMECL